MKNRIIIFLKVFLIFVMVFGFINSVQATEVIGAMDGLHNTTYTNEKLKPIINTVIGFIQITGTGISVIMVTVLGIKYMLAAPSDKADVKKQIAPLLIGAVLLFASVNIIQIIADFSATLPTGTAAS